MYLSDVIEPLITQRLKEMCVDKKVLIHPIESNEKEITINCKSVKFGNDDGDCWLEFIDDQDNKYNVVGQGIDIYFEIVE